MKLATLATGFAIAAFVFLAGASSVHAQTQTQNSKTDQTAQTKQTTQANQPEQPKTVTVAAGDTLTGIADNNQTTYQRMFDANTQINDPDLIYPGDNLRVPNPDEQLAERAVPTEYVAAAAQSSYAPAAPPHSAATAPVAAAPAVQAAPVSSGCGDNQYANFIYMRESGCRTTAMSPNGCYGIGQACPAGKIAYCGADYACQNAFFSSYAAKYGGWAGAYAFWQSHGWW